MGYIVSQADIPEMDDTWPIHLETHSNYITLYTDFGDEWIDIPATELEHLKVLINFAEEQIKNRKY